MDHIVNNDKMQLAKIKNAICIAVPKTNKHYLLDSILMMYLYDLDTKSEHIINLSHGDFFPWDLAEQPDLQHIRLYSPTKKSILKNYIQTDYIFDLNFLIYPFKHKVYNFEEYIPKKFYQHKNRYTSYDIFPLAVLTDICRSIAIEMEQLMIDCNSHVDDIKVFDDLYYRSLYKLERNPINFESNLIYSDYNPYTITNRPTNSSFGINLSALSKKDDTRSKLQTKFPDGKLVQFDYSSFHVHLLTKMLNFELPNDSDVYLFLNEKYNFSQATSRNQIKLDFFKYIYGTREYNNPLSDEINSFKNRLYSFFESNGYVHSFFLNRKILFNVQDLLQSNKLFNYYLQNAETEYNLLKLLKINELLKLKSTNILLYTYDSFLVDIPRNESALIGEIQSILEQDGIPVNIQIGANYGELRDIY
jgi:hypothetical protein